MLVARPEPTLEMIHRAVSHVTRPSSDFDLNPGAILPAGRKLRNAAVLVAIQEIDGRLGVWLTKRSAALRHHPGQVAFPGGKQDDSDPSLADAALREADEEIGLSPDNVELIGQLPAHETVTAFAMTPVVGVVKRPFTPVSEPGEVAEVFHVPLSHVLNPRNFSVEGRMWQGQMRRYYAVPFGPYYIWGATARILRSLAEEVTK